MIYHNLSQDKKIHSSHWRKLKIIYQSANVPWPTSLEKCLHKFFKDKRVDKEWFNLDECDIDEIEEWSEMCYMKYDAICEYNMLLEENSNNKNRIALLSKYYLNILNPDATSLISTLDYWNEEDLKYYYEKKYQNINEEDYV